MCINRKYNVIVGEYAKNHYIKPFKKKYKWAWDTTWQLVEIISCQIYKYFWNSIASKIFEVEWKYIAKCEFSIAWSNKWHQNAWNRFIVYVDEESCETTILLVYAKTDIKWPKETAWWIWEVKNNYKDIAKNFPWMK